MKLKNVLLTFITFMVATVSLFTQAHEGHAPAGIVHELHHMLWIVMTLAVSAVVVFLIRKSGKENENSRD